VIQEHAPGVAVLFLPSALPEGVPVRLGRAGSAITEGVSRVLKPLGAKGLDSVFFFPLSLSLFLVFTISVKSPARLPGQLDDF